MNTAHVYIYGIIDCFQDQNSSEYGYVNLTSVKNQIEAQKDFKDITVHIHSDGGEVNEGFAIHDYLRSLGKPINSKIEGNCFSIATVIALAGDTITMTSNAEFMIHNPWGYAGGSKEEIQKYADQLKGIENKIAQFYSEKTNLSLEEALELMKNQTFMTPQAALDKGFITEIESTMRAVALFKPNNQNLINKNEKQMDQLTKKEADKRFSKIENMFEDIKKAFKGKVKNLLIQDANGVEIDFTDLEDGTSPVVGDKATIDGTAASGDYVMPSGETYVFVDGGLTEIKPVENEDPQILIDENAALKAELTDLKAQNSASQNKLKTAMSSVESLKAEFVEFKKLAGSSYNFSGQSDPHAGQSGDKKRQLFKK
jgi:ATP-dependent protease ClpP protease subunit